MSYNAMPFIYLNMGGELIYILGQRLQDQNIERSKGRKVLQEIAMALLNPKCLSTIFEPQELYSRKTLRQLFDQISNSSVMHLTKESMDKLYDLMTMPVKYQILLCKEPSELISITINHFIGMKDCFKNEPTVLNAIQHAQTLFMNNYANTPLWEMAVIRSDILNFFLSFRIKITRMLKEHRQLDDGRFVLFSENARFNNDIKLEIELPDGSMAPGSIHYNESPERVETFPVKEKFVLFDQQERAVKRGTLLGQNMYKNKENAEDILKNYPSTFYYADDEIDSNGNRKSVGNEVKLLSLLTGLDNSNSAQSTNIFSLNLFEDSKFVNERKEKGFDDESLNVGKSNKLEAKKKLPKRKKSLTTAMKEMKTKESDGITKRPESRSRSRGRGSQMLKMMDEATTTATTES